MPDDALNETNDLEWLLLSGQVSREAIAFALVGEYWGEISGYCQVVVESSVAAYRAAQASFTAALLEIHRYRSGMGARAWLYELALKACQEPGTVGQQAPEWAIDLFNRVEAGSGQADPVRVVRRALGELNRGERAVVALTLMAGFQPGQVSSLAGVKVSAVEAALSRYRTEIEHATRSLLADGSTPPLDSDQQLSEWLNLAYPLLALTDSQARKLAREVEHLAGQSEARRSIKNLFAEVMLVAAAVLAILGLVKGAGGLGGGSLPAQQVVYQTVLVTRIAPATPRIVYQMVPATPEPAAAETAFPEDWLYTVREGDTVDSIASAFGEFPPAELMRLNRLSPEANLEPGQKLLLPSKIIAHPPALATPVIYQEASDSKPGLQVPVSENIPEVYQKLRWLASGWQTLWLDMVSIDYGPEGYIGPSRVERTQAWLSGSQLLAIQGRKPSIPDSAWLANFDTNRYYHASPATGDPWFVDASLSDLFTSRPVANTLLTLFNPFRAEPASPGRHYEIAGIEQLGERQARMLNQYNAAGVLTRQLWVDMATGLVLQMLKYKAGGELVQKVLVNDMAVDIDLPQELLDPTLPWRGGYASDYHGNPEAESATTAENPAPLVQLPAAPTGLDPAGSQLAFRYPEDFDQDAAEARVEIQAGGFSLGEVDFGNPWSLICDRSPDGRKLAYVSQPSQVASADGFLHWIDLTTQPLAEYDALGGITITALAFSPDSQRLAAFGYYQTIKGLYVVDMQPFQPRRVIRLERLSAVAWSSDGLYLGVLGLPYMLDNQDQIEHILVIRLRNGRIIFDQPVSGVGDLEELLKQNWDMSLPARTGGLESCLMP